MRRSFCLRSLGLSPRCPTAADADADDGPLRERLFTSRKFHEDYNNNITTSSSNNSNYSAPGELAGCASELPLACTHWTDS